VRKLFAIGKSDLKNLKFSTRGLTSRIENSADELRTSEDLAAFAASRANDLLLTEPRLAKLVNFDEDFERLFAQLVEQHSTVALAEASPAEVLPPKLSEVFYRLQQARKIWQPGTITVPVYKRKLEIPYAYKNGVVNLVKPHVFPASKHAESQAAMLAINGDLIRRHLIDGEKQELIVISTQETVGQAREINDHVEPLFKEYSVRLIRPNDVDAFASEVEKSAH
jgi:sulfur transfer complex TusBCD TusB component (DsrH family)